MCQPHRAVLFFNFSVICLLLYSCLSAPRLPRWSTVYRGVSQQCSGSRCVRLLWLSLVRTVYWSGMWIPAHCQPGMSTLILLHCTVFSCAVCSFHYTCFFFFSTHAGLHLVVHKFCLILVTLQSLPSPGRQADLSWCRPRLWTQQWWYEAAASSEILKLLNCCGC